MKFSSSRTLPGQWYSVKAVMALAAIESMGFFIRRACFCAK